MLTKLKPPQGVAHTVGLAHIQVDDAKAFELYERASALRCDSAQSSAAGVVGGIGAHVLCVAAAMRAIAGTRTRASPSASAITKESPPPVVVATHRLVLRPKCASARLEAKQNVHSSGRCRQRLSRRSQQGCGVLDGRSEAGSHLGPFHSRLGRFPNRVTPHAPNRCIVPIENGRRVGECRRLALRVRRTTSLRKSGCCKSRRSWTSEHSVTTRTQPCRRWPMHARDRH